VKHDGEDARFANYDEPALEISRGGETISLGANQGAVVPRSGEAEVTEVLTRVELQTPLDGAEIHDQAVTLAWRPMQGAEAYWLEVAADADFNAMQVSEWGVREASRTVEGLEPGEHFWRVSSLDRLGLPGVRSLSRRFRLVEDDTPPFLTLREPEEGEIVSAAEVALAGESEPGVRLSVNGRPVPVGDDGGFSTTVQATLGSNSVVLEAVDRAGNRTERSRRFVFRPVEAVTVALDPGVPRDADGRLLTRAEEIDVAGTSDAGPSSLMRVLAPGGAAVVQTAVAEDGSFRFTVPASAAGIAYRLEIVGPDGRVEGTSAFAARRDGEAPEVVLDAPPPSATANAWLEIAGAAPDAVAVSVAGSEAALAGGRFDAVATLVPGENVVELVAEDAVGNVTVQRIQTVYDVDPPEILGAAAARPQGAGGPIEIVVEARDGSGLRQAAPFVLAVGGVERRGFLRCDSAAGTCREALPPEPGALRLIEVAVEDYAGNVAKRQE
jgi:hypothetical protein